MPEPASNPPPKRQNLRDWLPPWRTLLWVALAFLAGLLLFAWVWSKDRNQDDFFRAGETPPTATAPDYRPLPVPSPAGSSEASGLDPDQAGAGEDAPRDDQEAQPRLVEVAPPAAPSAAPPPPTSDAGISSQPSPIAGSMPAPRYPRRALRRGESGVVLVRARIGPDGIPTLVEVVNGSGSRDLDRAAVDAVKRWRFQPARQNGRATVGTVNIPIEFAPTR